MPEADWMLDKISIARTQLLTAIDLFFEDGDPVSIHTLAGAAQEVLAKLCLVAGTPPFSVDAQQAFPHLGAKEVHSAFSIYKNAFKHMDRDDTAALSAFSERENDALIFVACTDYARLCRRFPLKIHVFTAWFYAVYRDEIGSPLSPGHFADVFPGIERASRSEQKAIGKRGLDLAARDSDLMASEFIDPAA